MVLQVLVCVIACRGPDPPPPPVEASGTDLAFVEAPALARPGDDAVRLLRVLSAETDRPATVSWSVDDGRVRSTTEPRTSWELPVLGFTPDAVHGLEVTWTPTDGSPPLTEDFEVTTEPLPDLFPVLEVLADAPDRHSGRWTLFTAEYAAVLPWYVTILLDEDHRVVFTRSGWTRVWPMQLTDEGTLTGLSPALDGLLEVDWSWDVVRRTGTVVDHLHHESVSTSTGAWTLQHVSAEVDAYPVDYDRAELAPASVRDSRVMHLAPDGRIDEAWSLAERLDPTRIGFDALDETPAGFDWAHANGIAVDPVDGGVWVSLRHQDVVAKLSASGDLQWLLGDPAGWGPGHAEHLLAPVGSVTWPYHQHAPALADDGTLWLFDNHNHGATPYDPTAVFGEPQWSRVVGYRIDLVEGTVEQVASLDTTATGQLFSVALGDADPLPGGTVLGVWGALRGEGDGTGVEISNVDRGWSSRSARIVELDPARPGEPALDLRVRGDESGAPGWMVYRAERLDSPWGSVAR